MNHELLLERMYACGLSLWELGDLLGIHPHHLHRLDPAGGLIDQPIRVIIELARRLDMHPADLVPSLEPVLTNRRTPAAETPPPTMPTPTPLVVLTALATTATPLDVDELASALTWTLERTAAALEHAVARPHLAGPAALRRAPPGRWTVTARRDVLTPQQHPGLAETARYHGSLTLDEANALLAAYRLGHTDKWADRRSALPGEQSLKETGLIFCHNGPHRARPSDDVNYSLNRQPNR